MFSMNPAIKCEMVKFKWIQNSFSSICFYCFSTLVKAMQFHCKNLLRFLFLIRKEKSSKFDLRSSLKTSALPVQSRLVILSSLQKVFEFWTEFLDASICLINQSLRENLFLQGASSSKSLYGFALPSRISRLLVDEAIAKNWD